MDTVSESKRSRRSGLLLLHFQQKFGKSLSVRPCREHKDGRIGEIVYHRLVQRRLAALLRSRLIHGALAFAALAEQHTGQEKVLHTVGVRLGVGRLQAVAALLSEVGALSEGTASIIIAWKPAQDR